MRIFTVSILLALSNTCFAEEQSTERSSRASQGQIQYSNSDGNKVNWKFYNAPHDQRAQRQETGSTQPKRNQITAYKPYSMIPSHIKQLMFQAYQPPQVYVDPAVYIYKQTARNSDSGTENAGVMQYKGDMPSGIQQLLYLQAQIPYHVIANEIQYQPKSVFVPKPLPFDEKSSDNYRTKMYDVMNE